MARLVRLVLVLAIGAVAGWPVAPRVIGPAASRDGLISPAVVESWGHLTLLRLRGTPYEMGYQHGVAQREVIRRWVSQEVYGRRILGQGQSCGVLLAHARQMADGLPLEIRRELRGIADGAGVSYEDVLLLNLVLNRLLSQPLTSSSAPFASPALDLQVLAFVAWPPATRQEDALDNTFLGYRLEAPGQADRLRRHLLAIVYQPDEGQAYVTLTWSGQAGAWCGLNQAGLAICATPAKGEEAGDRELVPAVLTRHLLSRATDSEQALRLAVQHDYVAAFQLLIADGPRQSAMSVAFGNHRYEVSPAAGSQPGVLVLGQDSLQAASLLRRNAGWLDRDKALAVLAARQPLDGGSPGLCDEATLFNVLFVPGRDELWVGVGLWPAFCRRYLCLGLAD